MAHLADASVFVSAAPPHAPTRRDGWCEIRDHACESIPKIECVCRCSAPEVGMLIVKSLPKNRCESCACNAGAPMMSAAVLSRAGTSLAC